MYLLDTNVVSEIMASNPAPGVSAWIDSARPTEAKLASVVVAEIAYGLAIMPEGARKDAKASRFASFVAALDVLPFDLAAAEMSARIRAERQAAGRPIGFADAQIAVIARARGLTVVTRDAAGFLGCGVAVVDPWSAV